MDCNYGISVGKSGQTAPSGLLYQHVPDIPDLCHPCSSQYAAELSNQISGPGHRGLDLCVLLLLPHHRARHAGLYHGGYGPRAACQFSVRKQFCKHLQRFPQPRCLGEHWREIYIVFICLLVLWNAVVYFGNPETKGVSLEEISNVFDDKPGAAQPMKHATD